MSKNASRPFPVPRTKSRRASPAAAVPTVFVTPGEPAGIGPDLILALARRRLGAQLVVVADPEFLRQRARALRLRVDFQPYQADQPVRTLSNSLQFLAVPLAAPARAGKLDPRNAAYVLNCLRLAVRACQQGTAAAMVTGPVHKGVIADAGFRFSGHTEFLAELTGTAQPVMLLIAGGLRVALATTHLPLRSVADAITARSLRATLQVLAADLQRRFGIKRPRILVAGLNPHAGEQGHLGREDIDIIAPVVRRLRRSGLRVEGPLPADTLFTPPYLSRADAVLAMYHDQGLPVLKHQGFGRAVNVTLGLPIVRTSVDHGTALDLAGTGKADPGSLALAIETAVQMAGRRRG